MSSIYYLYIKTHNQTGLKYLGQTSQNPYEYKGSGIYWKSHLQKHGKDISTELIAAFDTKDDLKIAGQFWSKHWNVVNSNEWANLKEETGDGGRWYYTEEQRKNMGPKRKLFGNDNPSKRPEVREKIRLAKLGMSCPWVTRARKGKKAIEIYKEGWQIWNKGIKN